MFVYQVMCNAHSIEYYDQKIDLHVHTETFRFINHIIQEKCVCANAFIFYSPSLNHVILATYILKRLYT